MPRETFEADGTVSQRAQGSRKGANKNKHPATRRGYYLRSFDFCELCSRRMFGKTIRNTPYYSWQPRSNNPHLRELPAGHPSTIHVREDALLQGLLEFLSQRIFGAQRRELLKDTLLKVGQRDKGLSERKLRSLQKKIDSLDARQARLLNALENDDDPGGIMFRQIRDRMIGMEADRKAAIEELALLSESDMPQDPDLLDILPLGEIQPPSKPNPELYGLFESLRLQLHYDHRTTQFGAGSLFARSRSTLSCQPRQTWCIPL